MNEEKVKYKRKLVVEKPIVINKKKNPLKTFLVFIVIILIILLVIYFLESKNIINIFDFI